MKYLVVIALALVAFVATVRSGPAGFLFGEAEILDEEPSIPLEQGPDVNIGVRQKPMTCGQLNTPIGPVSHSLCVFHCLNMRMRFRGGRCENGVCICRSDISQFHMLPMSI